MSAKKSSSSTIEKNLKSFFQQNPGIDFEQVDLTADSTLDHMNWKGLNRQKKKITGLLQAYQRLWRLLPDRDHATIVRLIEHGLLGAVQIAAIPAGEFFKKYDDLFAGDHTRMETFYKNAVNTRSLLLQNYMNTIQR